MIGIAAIGVEEVAGRLARAVEDVQKQQNDAIKKATFVVRAAVSHNMSGAAGSATLSDGTNIRTGATPPMLARLSGGAVSRLTPGGRVYRMGNEVTGVVGSPDKYVAWHEHGGTIHGKPWLVIPLRGYKNTKAAGKRASAKGFKRTGGSIGVVTFRKVKSVTQPPRPVFATSLKQSEPAVNALVHNAVSEVVRRANGGA